MELYIGQVVNNNDPDKVGKVLVRIPELNGANGASAKDSDDILNWFEPCVPFYGGYQYGSFIVPPVGAIVWCIISEVETGDPYKLYLGGCFGTGTIYGKKFGGVDVPKGKLETPKEAIEDYPDTSILFKSLKGSIIMVDGSGVITISNPNGSSVEVGENSISINTSAASMEVRGDNKIIINGDVEINGNLKVSEDIEIDNSLKVTKDVEIDNSLKVIENVEIGNSLEVNENAEVNKLLTVGVDTVTNSKSFISHVHKLGQQTTSVPL